MRIIALTSAGKALADRILQHYPNGTLDYKPKPFAEQVQAAFIAQEPMIFICATGIVMRTLAPVLQDKYQDPPILVMDELGQFVIPLLSGHEGGANEWAAQIAQKIQAQLVMTTAKEYLNPVYTLGMGCERNCPLFYLEDIMLETLQQKGLTPNDIASLNSIDIKADETQLIALAQKYQWPFHTYSADALMTMEPLLSTRSEYIFKTVGVYGVAESAALLAAQNLSDSSPELVVNKRKNTKATCALARGFSASK